ncbi:MAG: permease [Actinomycetota bacterium]
MGGRALLSFVVAVAAGWVLGARGRDELLRARAGECADGTCGHDHDSGGHEPEPRWTSFFGHLTDDFMMMAKFLVIGAAVAATIQTFLPSSLIEPVAGIPVLSMLALMGLAAALSLCSQSDAFVAASLVQFGPASQLAFLVFGPMVDAKLLFLYRGTFSKGFVRNLVVTMATVTLAGTLWMEIVLG